MTDFREKVSAIQYSGITLGDGKGYSMCDESHHGIGRDSRRPVGSWQEV